MELNRRPVDPCCHLLERIGDMEEGNLGYAGETPEKHAIEFDTPPLVRFSLCFCNVTYHVKNKRKMGLRSVSPQLQAGDGTFAKTKMLLNNISGEAREGEIMAVLGASGSGKSTLIDAFAGGIAKESLKGSIRLNGQVMESGLHKTISAYVRQDDLLFPMLTVEETLMFSAEFCLPRILGKSKKKARVQALIDHLGLRDAANTMIGDEGHRGISGGERRRVSIGIEIIHDPILLFLDEPTSGLDSTSAFVVVQVLKKIAHSGSVVIMSIHQPSYRIFCLLDRLLFLSHGQNVFSGSPTTLPYFFSEYGHPIPKNENPTDFALDLIRELEGTSGGVEHLVEFNKTWQNRNGGNGMVSSQGWHESSLKEAIRARMSKGRFVFDGHDNANPNSLVPTFANPFWIEMVVLSKRSAINSCRLPELLTVRLATVLSTGFVLATIFWQLGDSPTGMQERMGFFAFTMSTTFYICGDSLPVFIQERYIFMRETAHNAYRRSSYVLSHAIVSFPPLISLSIAFAATTFWAVGLRGGLSGFSFFFLIILASFWCGNSFVTFVSAVVPHVLIGFTIVVAMLAYFLLFSGFFVTQNEIPGYLIWFHYVSLIKYPYEGILLNEFNDPAKCFVRGVQIFDNGPFASQADSAKLVLLEAISKTLGKAITGSTCLTTGADVLRQLGIGKLSKWDCLWIIIAWGFLFRFLFYLALLLGSKNKRR